MHKKLFQLIEDCNVLLVNEGYGHKVDQLKTFFKDNCLQCSLNLRQSTLFLRDCLKLKSEVDGNLICLLPDELFDSFQEELTLKQLKVCVCFLCLFVLQLICICLNSH